MRFPNLLLCATLLILFIAPVYSEDNPVFEIHSAMFELDENLLRLNARIGIELPDYIAIAVDQGFAVPMNFQVEILESRNYWLDRKIVSLKQQYRLNYLPMLDAYVVSDINQGHRAYFESRDDAVNSMQSIIQYPMLDIGNIDTDLSVYARMRFGLDSEELPLPLKSSSLWHKKWDLKSEWFSWGIDRAEL